MTNKLSIRHLFLPVMKNAFSTFTGGSDRRLQRILVNQGKILASRNEKLPVVNDLSDLEFSVYSQWGEDGIIEWIVASLPNIERKFVEFGVQNYKESNTRFLTVNRNWSGLVFDGSVDNISEVRRQEIYWKHNLKAETVFVTAENINERLLDFGMEGDIGLLSIDIDGNDYWVWSAINVIRPSIVVIEYNAGFGDKYSITVPYRADFFRTKAHYSNLYFGASLKALVGLGVSKGYTFLGTCSAGVNAFFVDNGVAPAILNNLKNIYSYPSLFREGRNKNGSLTFRRSLESLTDLKELSVVDLDTSQEMLLENISNLYSPEWRNGEPSKL